MTKKSDDDLVKEIMEAGWGYHQPGLLGTAAHFGGKMAVKGALGLAKAGAKGIGAAARAAGDAYYSDPAVQQKQHNKLRNDVINKISRDFDNWSTRMTGSTVPSTVDNVAQFIHDTYGIDAKTLVSAGQQPAAPAPAAPAAPQAGASPVPKVAPAAPNASPWGKAADAPHSPNTPAPAAPDAPVAAGTDVKPAPNARAKKPVRTTDEPYRHDSSGIDFGDPHLQPTQPIRKKPMPQQESARSFSQIVNERLMDDAQGEAQAMVFGLARRVLSSVPSAQAFLQNGTVSSSAAPAAPSQAAPAPKAKPAATPAAAPAPTAPKAPAQPAAGGGDDAMKSKLNDIIVNQLHMKIDSGVVQGVVEKLKKEQNLNAETASELIDSPAEIETARAIMLAVIMATEK